MVRYPFAPRLARAKDLGVSTAAVYERLYDLCQERVERTADYHDGRFWVRMPHKDFPRIFPYLSVGTVSEALRKLRKAGLVTVGQYDGADGRCGEGGRVNWYTIT